MSAGGRVIAFRVILVMALAVDAGMDGAGEGRVRQQ
jgi:hypothetical protein